MSSEDMCRGDGWVYKWKYIKGLLIKQGTINYDLYAIKNPEMNLIKVLENQYLNKVKKVFEKYKVNISISELMCESDMAYLPISLFEEVKKEKINDKYDILGVILLKDEKITIKIANEITEDEVNEILNNFGENPNDIDESTSESYSYDEDNDDIINPIVSNPLSPISESANNNEENFEINRIKEFIKNEIGESNVCATTWVDINEVFYQHLGKQPSFVEISILKNLLHERYNHKPLPDRDEKGKITYHLHDLIYDHIRDKISQSHSANKVYPGLMLKKRPRLFVKFLPDEEKSKLLNKLKRDINEQKNKT